MTQPAAAPPKVPPFHAGRALALLVDQRCACPPCDGTLATSDWPSWRRCSTCGCHWKTVEINGRQYPERVRRGCPPVTSR